MTLSIILSVLILITLIPTLLLLFNVQKRLRQVENAKTELGALQEKITQSETEIKNEIKSNQTTISNTLTQQIESTTTTLVNILETLGNNQTQALENVTKSTQNLTQSNETRMDSVQKALNERFTTLQTSNEQKLADISKAVTNELQNTSQTLVTTIGQLEEGLQNQLKRETEAINTLTQANEKGIENVRKTVDQKLKDLQTSNEQKLEQINTTVNQKLQTTLTERLQEAFNHVSERLESVHKGLGKMQNLAENVGNLQRVLTDVRARGTWGEVMLGTILDEILTPDQYDTQVKISDGEQRVDFAIRLPGNSDVPDSPVWLPIDSKFPISAYQELAEATNTLDKNTEQAAIRRLTNTVIDNARSIQEKYIAPPHTTEFAIMFLPTEGLYAEVVRQPGQVEQLLREYRVVVAGPTTLASILLSIRVGFQTLAIQKHSTELWDILATVQNGFRDFDEAIRLLKTHLNRATNTVDRVDRERQRMDKALSTVEQHSSDETSQIQSPTDGEQSEPSIPE
ncbi:MAG: DNA recombination protein RmuC [Candidatus Poribacteria bacterium]|nr:DNA recombination protein RmuC [Candidatus Poribacteria bacterium]